MMRALWEFIFPSSLHGHYDTVRYAFPVMFVAAFLATMASVISHTQSYVTISTDVDSVTRDQEFFVDVQVSAHVPVNAVDLQISYPEDTLEILGIDTGMSVITLWTEDPYAKDGVVYLRGGTFRKGFIGEHDIARIRVRAQESGEARLFVKTSELVAGDGLGTSVEAEKDTARNSVRIFVSGEDDTISGEAVLSVITDANGDGEVNIADITLFMSAWLTRSQIYDFDNDGRMTFKDFSILLADSFLR